VLALGWKKKAETLRMVIVSSAHQIAKELPPGIQKILDAFSRVARTGDGRGLQDEIAGAPPDPNPPLWEPAQIHGWDIRATLYRRDGQLWWLVSARTRNEREPSDKDLVFLDKVLDHLGAVPRRHAIIEPTSSPPGEPRLPFGWWTWQNRWPLFEVQVKGRGKAASMRIVPHGSRETDGYECVDLSERAADLDGGDGGDP
jgi:hypothetical protein